MFILSKFLWWSAHLLLRSSLGCRCHVHVQEHVAQIIYLLLHGMHQCGHVVVETAICISKLLEGCQIRSKRFTKVLYGCFVRLIFLGLLLNSRSSESKGVGCCLRLLA